MCANVYVQKIIIIMTQIIIIIIIIMTHKGVVWACGPVCVPVCTYGCVCVIIRSTDWP